MGQALKLTLKKAKFAKEYIKNGGNGVQAALNSYDTDNYESAASLAHQNLADPNVMAIIQEAFDELKASPKKYIKKLDQLASSEAEKITAEAVIKANIELLKIARVYPGVKQTNINVSMKIKDMTLKEAKETLQKIRTDNDSLLQETLVE